MDKDKMNQLIDDFDPVKFDKTMKTIAAMSDIEFARADAKLHDRKAKDDVGIERLTLFVKGNNCENVLLVKPSQSMPIWMLNLRQYGQVSLAEGSSPTFTITEIDSNTFRFTMENGGNTVFWVDLLDNQMAEEAAKFVGAFVCR